jgi:hypothetical protein
MGVSPNFFQRAHCCGSRRDPRGDVVVITKAIVYEGAKIAEYFGEADISISDWEVCSFREFVICSVITFSPSLCPIVYIFLG